MIEMYPLRTREQRIESLTQLAQDVRRLSLGREVGNPVSFPDMPWQEAQRYEAAINAERAGFGLKPIGIGFPGLHTPRERMEMPPGASRDERTLFTPEGIAVDGAGQVWVADTGNHRIVKLSSTLEFLGTWGGLGRRPGQFQYPRGIAVDGAGAVYVADWGTSRIQKLGPDGTPLLTWGKLTPHDPSFAPWSVAVTHAGEVYVDDDRQMYRFTAAGQPLGRWRLPLRYVNTRVAVDATGHVYALGWERHILKFDGNGTLLAKWTGRDGGGESELSHPRALAVGPAGQMYVLDWKDRRPRLVELDARGLLTREWGVREIEGMRYPQGLAVAPDGTIYITDFVNFDERGRVLMFRPEGGR